MGNPKDYREFVNRVNMYLDNELTQEQEQQLLSEIRSNPVYNEVLSKEKSFREFIRSKVYRRPVSPSLIQSIKEKIRVAPA